MKVVPSPIERLPAIVIAVPGVTEALPEVLKLLNAFIVVVPPMV